MSLRKKRFLIAKLGLDGHDVGAKVIALALRDAGADVVYTGLRKTPAYVARVAVDEDVDAVGLSLLSGAHRELVAETLEQLQAQGGSDIAVFVGGTIPESDRREMLGAGVLGVFTSEMKLEDVLAEIDRSLSGGAG